MEGVFVGSEALAAGRVTRHQLATAYRRLLPDVYAPKLSAPTLLDRTVAAWLWSGRRGVVTGAAASALHGARWVDERTSIELNLANGKPPASVITRNETLLDGEVTRVKGMRVTTVDRTAFDLARRGSVGVAVERLDALAHAAGFKTDDVLMLARGHPGVRELRRVAGVLGRVDHGAQSPKETWLRLLLVDGGFPAPQTQIPVPGPDGYPRYYLDMGWREVMVAVEYDGEQHRVDRDQFRRDVARAEYIDGRGWRRVRVLAGDRRADIIARVRRAWADARR